MNLKKEKKRIVIKIGTSTLTYGTGRPNLRLMEVLCTVLADLKNSGYDIILVSSGAIAFGLASLKIKNKPSEAMKLQAASAVGQNEMMFLYNKFFSQYNVTVSQLLFTSRVLDDPERRQNAVNTFNQLLKYDCLPIVNENDCVSVEELFNSDNDRLCSTVAILTDADLVIMLTDTDGLYDSNPKKNKNAKLISLVPKVDDYILSAAGESDGLGTGGFTAKVRAARRVTAAGIPMVITNGDRPRDIYKIVKGQKIGTYFEVNNG